MVYMYHSFLIHSSADGHLGCFHVLAMINSAAMNIGVHVFLSDLVSLVCMPRSGISVSVFYNECLRAKSRQPCPTLCDPMGCSPPGSSGPWDSSVKNTGMRCPFLLQEIFPTQELNSSLLYPLRRQAGSLQLAPPGNPIVYILTH